ncbi:RHS repeat domain-containing protein [Massilia sp. W12]|uniref:RHS repeat domain-containing protein n=1 Tax=Massilia sp. W12 TaxID=3126507 RepID=UPI0030CD3007
MYYDCAGNLRSVSKPLRECSSFTCNHAGLLLEVTDTLSHKTSFSYDKAGNL